MPNDVKKKIRKKVFVAISPFAKNVSEYWRDAYWDLEKRKNNINIIIFSHEGGR